MPQMANLHKFLPLFLCVWEARAFCEGTYGGIFRGASDEPGHHYPEYGNSFSALFMVVVGLHMLFFWDSKAEILTLLSSLFVVNGWGSFMFHRYGKSCWGELDADSMTLAALMMWGFVCQLFVECYVHKHHRQLVDEGRFVHRALMGVAWVIPIVVAFWIMTGATVPGSEESLYRDIFEMSFALPIAGSIILMLIIILCGWIDHDFLTQRQRRMAIARFFIGLLVASIGLMSWIFTEKTCASLRFARIFPGHLMWHLAMPWGIMNMLIIMVFLKAPLLQRRPKFRREQGIKGWYFFFMPAFEFRPRDEQCSAAEADVCRMKSAQSSEWTDALPRAVSAPVFAAEHRDSASENVRDLEAEAHVMVQSLFADGTLTRAPGLDGITGASDRKIEELITKLDTAKGDAPNVEVAQLQHWSDTLNYAKKYHRSIATREGDSGSTESTSVGGSESPSSISASTQSVMRPSLADDLDLLESGRYISQLDGEAQM